MNVAFSTAMSVKMTLSLEQRPGVFRHYHNWV
jgi:hypothetical protein